MSLLSDAELVTLTQRGNLQAFNSLAQKWDASLYRFARRFLGNDEDARDVCQEALVKAYLNINRLRDPAKFKSWVHHIALNLCRDRSRSARVRHETASYEEAVAAATETAQKLAAGSDRQAYRTVLTEVLGRRDGTALGRAADRDPAPGVPRVHLGGDRRDDGRAGDHGPDPHLLRLEIGAPDAQRAWHHRNRRTVRSDAP